MLKLAPENSNQHCAGQATGLCRIAGVDGGPIVFAVVFEHLHCFTSRAQRKQEQQGEDPENLWAGPCRLTCLCLNSFRAAFAKFGPQKKASQEAETATRNTKCTNLERRQHKLETVQHRV